MAWASVYLWHHWRLYDHEIKSRGIYEHPCWSAAWAKMKWFWYGDTCRIFQKSLWVDVKGAPKARAWLSARKASRCSKHPWDSRQIERQVFRTATGYKICNGHSPMAETYLMFSCHSDRFSFLRYVERSNIRALLQTERPLWNEAMHLAKTLPPP